MNLVLMGYRGTGKTTIGRMLSAELGMPYVSLDEEIVKRVALSIPEMVARYSWEYFRDREEEVVAAFAGRDGQVLDTGGGVVTRPVNIERLKKSGLLFLLEARPNLPAIAERKWLLCHVLWENRTWRFWLQAYFHTEQIKCMIL